MKLPFSLTKLGATLLALVPLAKLCAPHRPEIGDILTSVGTLAAGVGVRNAIGKIGK